MNPIAMYVKNEQELAEIAYKSSLCLCSLTNDLEMI